MISPVNFFAGTLTPPPPHPPGWGLAQNFLPTPGLRGICRVCCQNSKIIKHKQVKGTTPFMFNLVSNSISNN